jgi:hypothetical protein
VSTGVKLSTYLVRLWKELDKSFKLNIKPLPALLAGRLFGFGIMVEVYSKKEL